MDEDFNDFATLKQYDVRAIGRAIYAPTIKQKDKYEKFAGCTRCNDGYITKPRTMTKNKENMMNLKKIVSENMKGDFNEV